MNFSYKLFDERNKKKIYIYFVFSIPICMCEYISAYTWKYIFARQIIQKKIVFFFCYRTKNGIEEKTTKKLKLRELKKKTIGSRAFNFFHSSSYIYVNVATIFFPLLLSFIALFFFLLKWNLLNYCATINIIIGKQLTSKA